MESSAEVAPFGFLPALLRGKPAFVISAEGIGKMMETPAEPPFLSTQRVEIEGRISDLGKLTARIRYQLRGDNEFVLRLAFHRTPPAQWKELAQTILALDGVHGQVVSVEPGDPTDTENPFALEIDYSQPNYLDWSSQARQCALPLLTIGMPDAPRQPGASGGMELGTPLRITAHLKLALPPGFSLRPPVAIAVSRDYAEFKSSYQLRGSNPFRRPLCRLQNARSARFAPGRLCSFLPRRGRRSKSDSFGREFVCGEWPAIPGASPDELFEVGEAALAAGNLIRPRPFSSASWNSSPGITRPGTN